MRRENRTPEKLPQNQDRIADWDNSYAKDEQVSKALGELNSLVSKYGSGGIALARKIDRNGEAANDAVLRLPAMSTEDETMAKTLFQQIKRRVTDLQTEQRAI